MTVSAYEHHAAGLSLAIYCTEPDEESYYRNLLKDKIFDALVVNRGTVTGLHYCELSGVLYVVYRGTASREDMRYDAVGGAMRTRFGQVRAGFYRGHRRTYRGVRQYIEEFWDSAGELPLHIVVCGHSLGAASGLCALIDLWEHYPSLQSRLVYVGFGAPRALRWGTARMLSLEMQGRIFTFMARGDPVPSVPPMITGWRHPLTIRYMSKRGMEVREEWGVLRRFIMSCRHALLGAVTRAGKHSMSEYFADLTRYPIDRGRVIESISDNSVTLYAEESDERLSENEA